MSKKVIHMLAASAVTSVPSATVDTGVALDSIASSIATKISTDPSNYRYLMIFGGVVTVVVVVGGIAYYIYKNSDPKPSPIDR